MADFFNISLMCFLPLLLKNFLNDSEMAPHSPNITVITFVFTTNCYVASHFNLLQKKMCFIFLSVIHSFTDAYTVEHIITSRKAVCHESRKIYSELKVQFVEVVMT